MAELIEDLMTSFVRDLRAVGRSEKTIKVYTESVTSFTRWLSEAGYPLTEDSLDKDRVVAWLTALGTMKKRGQGARVKGSPTLSENTRLTYFRGMRRFCRWLMDEDILAKNPFRSLPEPTPPDVPVAVLTDAEIAKIVRACSGKDLVDRRDEAIVRIFFDCGIRIAELAGLSVEDVDMQSDVIYVMGKGRRGRAIPFGANTARALDRYIRMRRQHKFADLDGFWLGQRGALTSGAIDERLRKRANDAGVGDVHAHRFRHTFAHDWLASDGQERDLMRLAGWKSTAMLNRYGASVAVERAHNAKRKLRRGDRV